MAEGLTLVHGSRHTAAEYSVHAQFFRACNASWLVAHSDLLLSTSNASLDTSNLARVLAEYPHRRKALVPIEKNSGRRCGHLQAIQELERLWKGYRFVLFLHPDVYILPRGFATIGAAIRKARDEAAFIVTPFGYKGQSPNRWKALRMYNTDCFVFFPSALRIRSSVMEKGTPSRTTRNDILHTPHAHSPTNLRLGSKDRWQYHLASLLFYNLFDGQETGARIWLDYGTHITSRKRRNT
ncbi:hypothetical protein AB1Y20_022233 [Prymnesium parvum]|uniref:Protein xylosyltransferase n=1 Tax=Prymnesium parvum TaxID=97485 RepID=A0AB34JGX5_PRYPA